MARKIKNNTEFLCNISELTALFTDSSNLDMFLINVVGMIAEHMHCPVCSIYLYHESNKELVLAATKGLNKESIGTIKLKLGEGLTGVALKELRPICEQHASKNSNFRYFKDSGEEKYESFLAVPIVRGTTKIGVMVIQNTEKQFFNEEDETLLRAITSQLANIIEMARLILLIDEKKEEKEIEDVNQLEVVKGKVAHQGFSFSEAVFFDRKLSLKRYREFTKQYTLKDFEKAVKRAEKQLEEDQGKIEQKLSDVASLIFSAQILMLKDQPFTDAIKKYIDKGINPPEAVIMVVEEYAEKFNKLPTAYLQEKSHDVRDIGFRILDNFDMTVERKLSFHGKIVIARDLLPSDALKLSSQNVGGIILLSGGVTSHVSILVRSLDIPMVIVDNKDLAFLKEGTKVLIDAFEGSVHIDPKKEIVQELTLKGKAKISVNKLKKGLGDKTVTKDGVRINLLANVNLLNDVKIANDFKAEGIGLYRTEFPFIIRSNFPSEDEQFIIYQKLVDEMKGKEITFRTLDIGGDKILSYYEDHREEKNPYLGMRSIRFSLVHQEIFRDQIKAILRAGYGQDIKIMFPMISSVEEFTQSKQIVLDCIEECRKKGVDCQHEPQIGMMVELPAVIELIEDFAQLTDFLSIGTNDFIQYMLAVDRTNEKVADLYLPHHPAVLRAIKRVVDAAIKYGKDISICGDMAHQENFLDYFMVLGVRKFSVNPQLIPRIHKYICQRNLKEIEPLLEKVLNSSKLSEIAAILS